jgi:hypothetical protein
MQTVKFNNKEILWCKKLKICSLIVLSHKKYIIKD